MLPRGIRSRNPGNLRWPGAKDFLGASDGGGGYAQFDTAQHGIRAMALNLLAYQRLHGIDTIRGIIDRWAPLADGNNVVEYIKSVSGYTTWGPDEHLKLDSPLVVLLLAKAIIRHENGQQPYTDAVLLEGINAALGGNGT